MSTNNPYSAYGSVTDPVVDMLNTDSRVMALGAEPVTTDLVGYDPTKKYILVTRQGGSYAWPKQAHPRIDITTVAPIRGDAEDMIEVCVAVMLQRQDDYTGHGCRFSQVKVETAPFQADDKLENTCRYIVALRILVTPVP
jgi:hypothetical protein